MNDARGNMIGLQLQKKVDVCDFGPLALRSFKVAFNASLLGRSGPRVSDTPISPHFSLEPWVSRPPGWVLMDTSH